LLDAYKGKCAITDCDAEEALEAAHIVPCFENGEDRIQNGLLLRADVHTLFDLDLLWIDPDTRRVALAPEMAGGYYKELEGKPLSENQVSPELRAGTIELRWRVENRRGVGKAAGA
jgi:predicted restriction endonuclease